ncbi:DKNYY domain-containing protein, partial [Patescibacteria group bacterium]
DQYDGKVYYCGQEIVEADYDTFIPLQGGFTYAKDINNVYKFGEIINGADPETIEIINENFTKDQNHVFWDIKMISGVDLNSFEPINSAISQDSSNIYCEDGILTTDVENYQFVTENTGYATDSINVYFWCTQLENSDSSTFEVVINDFAKDKNNIYYQGFIIDMVQDTFEPLIKGYSKDATKVYFRYEYLPEADATSFEVVPYNTYPDPALFCEEATMLDAYDDNYCYYNGEITDDRITINNPNFGSLITREKPYFSDVQKDSLDYFFEKEVFVGYGDGTFGYQKNLNRAELLKIVLEASGTPLNHYPNGCFPDVTGGEWYTNYVCTAQELDYISGYPDGTFKPGDYVNKVEAIKMIAEVMNWDLETEVPSYVDSYDDVQDSNEWFFTYVDHGLYYYFLEMNETRQLDPANFITRGDAAEILYRSQVSNLVLFGNGFMGANHLAAASHNFLKIHEYTKEMTILDFHDFETDQGKTFALAIVNINGLDQWNSLGIENPDNTNILILGRFDEATKTPELVQFYVPENQTDETLDYLEYFISNVDINDGMQIICENIQTLNNVGWYLFNKNLLPDLTN